MFKTASCSERLRPQAALETAIRSAYVGSMLCRRPRGFVRLVLAAVIGASWLSGCAARNPEGPPPKRIVQSPESGLNDLDLVARAIPPVGDVLPVQVAVTNVTLKRLTLDAQGVRAESASGASVAVLSPERAEQAAGGADKLAEALSRIYLVHVAGHQKAPTRGEMAAEGCLDIARLFGLAGGYALMFVCPIIIAGTVAKSAAVASSSAMQVADVALPSGQLASGVENRGYIFLPPGNYTAIELPLKNENTGGIETIVQAWDSAGDLANTTVFNPRSAASPPQQEQIAAPKVPQSADAHDNGDAHDHGSEH